MPSARTRLATSAGVSPPRTATFTALGRNASSYDHVPVACGCVSLWRPFRSIIANLVEPWAQCAVRDECIRPAGADGFKINGPNGTGLPSMKCRPGDDGRHCHRGDQSVLSILAWDLYRNSSDYLHNSSDFRTFFDNKRHDKDWVHDHAQPILRGCVNATVS